MREKMMKFWNDCIKQIREERKEEGNEHIQEEWKMVFEVERNMMKGLEKYVREDEELMDCYRNFVAEYYK